MVEGGGMGKETKDGIQMDDEKSGVIETDDPAKRIESDNSLTMKMMFPLDPNAAW